MGSQDLRIGFIGLGLRAQYLVELSQTITGCKVVGLCDKIEHLVHTTYKAARDTDIKRYTDHRKMLKEPGIDAVYIVVEPENNANLVCEALEAGKHVMCDVPLAYTIEDCWRVVLTVERTGLKFQMNEQTRYWPFIQAWKKMIAEDTLGKIIFVEGQYFHGMTPDRFWQDSETGAKLTLEEAENNPKAKKSRIWDTSHPILYLPHELSPILSILDDRVEKVTCMGTRTQSYYYEFFPKSDIEVALMHTAKDTILRVAAGFCVPTARVGTTSRHWYHVMGTKGRVETNRSNNDKMKMWLANSFMKDPADVNWAWGLPEEHGVPAEAFASGHGGADFWPIFNFIKSVKEDIAPPLDVYKAAETAAPAIIAAQSVEEGSKCLNVPDFRPGTHRALGQPLREKG